MATKRAVQLFPLRASSTLLRAQCSVPRRFVPRAASIRNVVLRQQVIVGQQRWHSAIPDNQRSIMYEFEDIQRIVESPDDSTLLIDVREPSEHNANSIPTAMNIPITSQPDALLLPPEEFTDRFGFAKPPLDKEVVFFCKAGVRSSAAAQIAKQAGYQHVGEYRGSFLDWERKGGIGTRTGPDRVPGSQPGKKGGNRRPGEINEGEGVQNPERDTYTPPGGYVKDQ